MASAKPLPSRETLLVMLDYDPASGVLTWRARKGKAFWNTRLAGTRAGSKPKSCNYRTIDIAGGTYLEHRIIWRMMTGGQPPQIDHINLDKCDNRWANLRPSDASTNQMNVRARAASGLKGAHWNAARQCWKSAIKLNGKSINLGRFDTAEAAHAAYARAAQMHFGAYARSV
jgi:hypothetical protein